MTLIVTALAEDAIVQVSDRRLIYPDGTIYSDNETKAVCVKCSDAIFSIAYTGLARLGLQRTARATGHWLVDFFSESGKLQMRYPELIKQLKAYSTASFGTLCHLNNGITIVLAGFGPPGPFITTLSNQEDSQGRWLDSVSNTFSLGGFFRNDAPLRKLDIMINGAEKAITSNLSNSIQKIRKHFFSLVPEKRVSVLVQLIRLASENGKSGQAIGKDCMSVIVKPNQGFVANYHPENSSAISYIPHFVTEGVVYRDLWISTDGQTRPSGPNPIR